MSNTKKHVTILAIIAIIGFVFATVGFIFNRADKADAAVVGQVVYTDIFDSEDGKLSDSWQAFGGAKVKSDYNAMRFNSSNYEWGAHVVNVKYKIDYEEITTSFTVEFSLKQIEEGGAWFAFSYGVENVLYGFPYSSGALIFYTSGSNLFKSTNGALANSDGSGYIRNFRIFHGKKVKVALTFNKVAAKEGYYNLSATCKDAQTEDLLSSHVYGEVQIANGYFGFNTSGMKVDIFDFNVYHDGNSQPVYSDDFTNSTVSYALESAENPTWYASSMWNHSNLIVGVIGKLDITVVNSGVTYVKAEEKPENNQLYLLYTLSADFYVENMANADSGFIIGADANGNGGTFIGLRKTTSKSRVVCYAEGKESEAQFGEENYSDEVIGVRLKVFCDNTAEITVGGTTYAFSVDNVDGYFGLKTLVCGTGEHIGAFVDNFECSDNQYVVRTNGDAKVNFEDTTETEVAGQMVTDYYCSSKNWHMGGNVSLPFIIGNNGYLIFSNAGDYDCFGPKQKYTDYIVRFDVTFDMVRNGSMFGIEVGKTDVSENRPNSVYVGFQKQGDDTYYICNKCLSADGRASDTITTPLGAPENVFVKDATYNFMAVVSNGTVKLYLKKASEDESVLAYERARFTDISTDGYVTMFAYEVSLKMDNFSVTNLDYEYFSDGYDGGEYLQTFRYDFSKGQGANDFAAVSGGTFTKDNTIELLRGKEGVSTTGKVGANVTRIRFADVEMGATYKHGNIEVKMDEAKGKIIVTDGVTEHAVNLGSAFNYKNSVMQIEETLGKVAVSFVSGDKPIAAISGNAYEFEVENDLTPAKINISSQYIASIKELSVFNLDTNVKIDSSVYVPQNARTEKKAIQDKGCSSAVGGELYAFLTLTTLAGAIMMIKRRQRNV